MTDSSYDPLPLNDIQNYPILHVSSQSNNGSLALADPDWHGSGETNMVAVPF